MATSNVKGAANNAKVKTGTTPTSDAGDPAVTLATEAEDAYQRALRKRDKQSRHLADAEDAVARADKARRAAGKTD
jgi:hypothetical protein